MEAFLNADEIAALDEQDPASKGDGGWQGLIVGFQERVDRQTGRLLLSAEDIRRIKMYANYDRGTWETRLKKAFERTLGPNLDGT
jgi:hypothetical protein